MSDPALPRVAPGARFAAHDRLAGRPHVVVDARAGRGTVLTLSHWPGSGTPERLADDTSALIVDRYLRAVPEGPPVHAVTNDHYDEDGLLGLWLLLERPDEDDPRRVLAVRAAEAGDFQTWHDPRAARVALTAMSLAERGTTPFPAVRRALSAHEVRDPAGPIYEAVLPHVGRLLEDHERFRAHWGPIWERVVDDVRLLERGEAVVEDHPALDLALVRSPRPLHRLAVHPRTRMMRILWAPGDGSLTLTYRYETWVRYTSRPLRPRVDLAPVLPLLNANDPIAGEWRFDGVAAVLPRLWRAGPGGRPAATGLDPDRLLALLEPALAGAGRT
jgi:hypothetical protein